MAVLNKPAETDSPQTGDNSHRALWIALLFISGGVIITLTVVNRKRRYAAKRYGNIYPQYKGGGFMPAALFID